MAIEPSQRFKVVVTGARGNLTPDAIAARDATFAARDEAIAASENLIVDATDGNVAAGNGSLASVAGGSQNSALGSNSLASVTTGSENTALGNGSGSVLTTASRATFVGAYAGQLATGIQGTGVGRAALINDVGSYNTAVGVNSGTKLTSASATLNTFIGAFSGADDNQKTDAAGSTAIGAGSFTTKSYQVVLGGVDVSETVLRGRIVINSLNALRMDDQANDNTYGLGGGPAGDSTGSSAGTGNLALGKLALANKNTNISCVAVGYKALNASTSGVDHTAIGVGAMENQIGGVGCTALGREAGFRSVNGTNWTALGDTALRDNLANLNVGVGYGAARDNTTGSVVAVGNYAAGYTKTAQRVTVVGTESFGGSGHGDDNTGVGYRVGSIMLGARNSLFGSETLLLAGTFNDVTALGYRAGFTTTGGSKNTFVGSNAGKETTLQKLQPVNTIALGADTYTTKDNQTVIGNSASEELVIHGIAFTKAQLLALKALVS